MNKSTDPNVTAKCCCNVVKSSFEPDLKGKKADQMNKEINSQVVDSSSRRDDHNSLGHICI